MEYFNATYREIRRLEYLLSGDSLSYMEAMKMQERCIGLYRDLYIYDREEYCKRFHVDA